MLRSMHQTQLCWSFLASTIITTKFEGKKHRVAKPSIGAALTCISVALAPDTFVAEPSVLRHQHCSQKNPAAVSASVWSVRNFDA